MRNLILLVTATACSAPSPLGQHRAATTVPVATFMHAGFTAGPVVFTDAGGHLLEERRTEPFGVPIGNPDLRARDLNELNKRTELATGWSDHGARWLVPETGRWLSPDPPVSAPAAKFMLSPWALHPYQYVNQNPVAYWDPDGREPEEMTPGQEVVHGLGGFVPGLGQLDGLKLAIRPLQSETLPVPVKIGYGIIAPIPVVILGTGSELYHMGAGTCHIVKGTARAGYDAAKDGASYVKEKIAPSIDRLERPANISFDPQGPTDAEIEAVNSLQLTTSLLPPQTIIPKARTQTTSPRASPRPAAAPAHDTPMDGCGMTSEPTPADDSQGATDP